MTRPGPRSYLAAALAAALVAGLAGGCADDSSSGGSSTPTPTPDPGGSCGGTTPVSGTNIRLETVIRNLDFPVYVTQAPGDTDRLYYVVQFGRIHPIVNGQQLGAFLNIVGKTSCCGERGILSLAFHPNWQSNRRFFILYTDTTGDVIVSEFTATSADFADPSTERELIRVEHRTFGNHNGGHLAFDRDGYLFASIGDGGADADPFGAGQDPTNWLGTILRLDVDGPTLFPPSNPFPGPVWDIGLRNPWRYSFDRLTDDMYISDVGEDEWEEINFEGAGSPGGRNYGWSAMEGNECFADANCQSKGYIRPAVEYSHADGCSITGGYVYRGCALPDLNGFYLYSDFCTAFLRGVKIGAGGVAGERIDLTSQLGDLDLIVSFGEDNLGELYMVTQAGDAILKIVPR